MWCKDEEGVFRQGDWKKVPNYTLRPRYVTNPDLPTSHRLWGKSARMCLCGQLISNITCRSLFPAPRESVVLTWCFCFIL